ncbi:olfactory receptor 14J1-like [Tachyglossus aculeatus]|uniref:olfactory receptor 14J1-like n=1 Tax=Tachyglossus aculeatus TaxID=9261 RepID=UPI0018F79A4E|nr:olfactory receptor 14J1-like [Tachyglossus aculeatus]
MTGGALWTMAAASWLSGGLSGLMHTAATFSGPFCGSNVIRQFFCDIPQLLKLSGSTAVLTEVGGTTFTVNLSVVCFAAMAASYIHIFRAVLRMRSAEGRAKAFSTCLPHLAVVIFSISTSGFAYLKPPSDSPSTLDLLVSMFYSVVPPTLNPLIYNPI